MRGQAGYFREDLPDYPAAPFQPESVALLWQATGEFMVGVEVQVLDPDAPAPDIQEIMRDAIEKVERVSSQQDA